MKSNEQKDKRPFREHPFEYLKPSSEDILHNWYQARTYVLNLLIETMRQFQDAETFPSSWHFVVDGDSDLMLSVVRHLALYAHFISYKESYDREGKFTCKNRTIISIVSKAESTAIKEKLEQSDFLGNLPKHCPITTFGNAENQDSYIDIAIEVVKDKNKVLIKKGYERKDITENQVLETLKSIDAKDIYSVHTLKAICAGKAYNLGDKVNNLPYEDIYSARRYFNALNTFRWKLIFICRWRTLIKNEEWDKDINAVRSGISNIFCSDCFEIREIEIKHIAKKEKKDDLEIWQKYMKELSCCEHNRWVVEKLILGYEPLSSEEKFTYEHLFGDDRAAYWKSLKKAKDSPKHIDICSNRDLRHFDPDSMKYDSFLMLAIPFILDYVKTRK
jgi:hypothetical protein